MLGYDPLLWDYIWVPPHENITRPHFTLETYKEFVMKYLKLRRKRYIRIYELSIVPAHVTVV